MTTFTAGINTFYSCLASLANFLPHDNCTVVEFTYGLTYCTTEGKLQVGEDMPDTWCTSFFFFTQDFKWVRYWQDGRTYSDSKQLLRELWHHRGYGHLCNTGTVGDTGGGATGENQSEILCKGLVWPEADLGQVHCQTNLKIITTFFFVSRLFHIVGKFKGID